MATSEPAPAMNPITTDSEMKRVKSPSLKIAIRIWIKPTMMPSRNMAWYISMWEEPVLKKARALKTTSEIAFVGPLIRWEEEPKIEATRVITIAE